MAPRETVYPGQESTVTLKSPPAPQAALGRGRVRQGLELYNKGTKENYAKAAERFAPPGCRPQYSQAALYLGRVERDLFNEEARGESLRRAIEIDPDYTEARATLGGMCSTKAPSMNPSANSMLWWCAIRSMPGLVPVGPGAAHEGPVPDSIEPPVKPSASRRRTPSRISGWRRVCASAASTSPRWIPTCAIFN
jgi:hypothetical protein